MARKTKKEVLEARQDERAPFLFDAESLPHRPDLVKAVQERRYEPTGARLLDDDAKVIRLVDLLMRHPPIGLRKIARALGCSRDTVRAAREALVAQGKLSPYRERVVKLYEDIIETGAASFLEDLENDRVPIGSKPLAIGIFADKRALAVGEPTAISVAGQAQLKPSDLSVEKLNSWFAALPVEGESTGAAQIPSQIDAKAPLDAALVPTEDQRPTEPTQVSPPPDRPPVALLPANAPTAPTGGGGSGGEGGG